MSDFQLVEILLVEDNKGDIGLTKEALEESKIKNNLHIVRDGEEAMEFIFKKGKHTGAASPDLILLDLNLPKKDGREVLAEIKKDPVLRRIPVVVLTTSDAEEDVLKVYDNYANCYIQKPVNFGKFVDVIKKIEDFWITVVKLPRVK